MNALTRAFIPAEAAVVGGLELKAVNNEIDKRIVEVSFRAFKRHELTAENVLQLKLWHEIGPILSQERRPPRSCGLALTGGSPIRTASVRTRA